MASRTLLFTRLFLLAAGLMTSMVVEGHFHQLMHHFRGRSILSVVQKKSFAMKMVEKHNAIRMSMGLDLLTRNNTLAEYAQRYAYQRSGDCQLVHSQGPYGENIYWAAGGGLETAAAAVKAWADEKGNYDHATNRCVNGKMCGHYTQVVWKSTQQLGCAHVCCANVGGYFVVCSYDPPGNYVGQLPY